MIVTFIIHTFLHDVSYSLQITGMTTLPSGGGGDGAVLTGSETSSVTRINC